MEKELKILEIERQTDIWFHSLPVFLCVYCYTAEISLWVTHGFDEFSSEFQGTSFQLHTYPLYKVIPVITQNQTWLLWNQFQWSEKASPYGGALPDVSVHMHTRKNLTRIRCTISVSIGSHCSRWNARHFAVLSIIHIDQPESIRWHQMWSMNVLDVIDRWASSYSSVTVTWLN